MNKSKKETAFLPVSIFIASVLVIMAFIIFALVNGKQIRKNNQQYLINDTKQIAGSIDQSITDGYVNINILSTLISQNLTSPQVNIQDYQKLISNTVFDFIEFTDKDGVDHNITGGTSDARDRAYYIEAMKGRTGMEVIFNSRATHENLMMFYSPVYYKGEIIGSLIGVYEGSKRITKAFSGDYFGLPARSFLCMEDGKVFASNEKMDASIALFIDNAINADYKLSKVLKNAIENNVSKSFTLEENKTGGYITPLENKGWYLVQIYPSEANEKMIERLNAIGLSLVVALLIIFMILMYIIKRFYKNQQTKEAKLLRDSNTDELTGCFNRRAYEDDIAYYPTIPTEENYVYIAMDINGLKNVNDNLGHEAGDELIVGAVSCMKRCLGNYGRIYRTGGDEFVAMIFADETTLEAIKKDFQEAQDHWKGKMVDQLAISSGYVTKREYPSLTVVELAHIADKRMYESKAIYYKQRGVDRKGQQAAQSALCSLYTKVLKINLTKDSYQVVNMDIDEQDTKMGFSDKISEWLAGFGISGQVYPEDLPYYLEHTKMQYLREYFWGDKLSLAIPYRRKYGDVYRQVVMEMIPADDYTNENQSIFLYVKSVER